jgi:hypothetical protein
MKNADLNLMFKITKLDIDYFNFDSIKQSGKLEYFTNIKKLHLSFKPSEKYTKKELEQLKQIINMEDLRVNIELASDLDAELID